MPKKGDTRMHNGIIHVVADTQTTFGRAYWRMPCRTDALFIDGGAGIRVGQWAYPTCLMCAAAGL